MSEQLKMNPEVKKKWVDALRSGKYKQGQEAMLANDEEGQKCYCCLGVLADLHCKTNRLSLNKFILESDNELPSLTPKFREWTGINPTNESLGDEVGIHATGVYVTSVHNDVAVGASWAPKVEIGGVKKTVAEHNDAGVSFEKLAKAIEEQL